jgi:hypothetical protein
MINEEQTDPSMRRPSMRRTMPRSLVAAAVVPLALVVAACAAGTQGSKVTGVYYTGDENPRLYLDYLATGPDVRTVVLGPRGTADETLAEAIIAAMNAHKRRTEVVYTDTPVSEAGSGYRVVMVVGGGPLRGSRLCPAVDGGETPRGGDRASLQAAFCYRGRSLSEAYVEVPSLDGPDDPNLDRAVAVAMDRLFPLFVPPDGPCRNALEC